MPHIAVIGLGITGVIAAYALERRGDRVTVLDRQPYAALETSLAAGAGARPALTSLRVIPSAPR